MTILDWLHSMLFCCSILKLSTDEKLEKQKRQKTMFICTRKCNPGPKNPLFLKMERDDIISNVETFEGTKIHVINGENVKVYYGYNKNTKMYGLFYNLYCIKYVDAVTILPYPLSINHQGNSRRIITYNTRIYDKDKELNICDKVLSKKEYKAYNRKFLSGLTNVINNFETIKPLSKNVIFADDVSIKLKTQMYDGRFTMIENYIEQCKIELYECIDKYKCIDNDGTIVFKARGLFYNKVVKEILMSYYMCEQTIDSLKSKFRTNPKGVIKISNEICDLLSTIENEALLEDSIKKEPLSFISDCDCIKSDHCKTYKKYNDMIEFIETIRYYNTIKLQKETSDNNESEI